MDWKDFVRALPNTLRRVIEQRDAIKGEAYACARTKSWSLSSIRSGWHPELDAVVEAIDTLREAHALFAAEDPEDPEKTRQALAEAFEALKAAIDDANDEAERRASRVARREVDAGVEALIRAADRAADDVEWEDALRWHLNRISDGDCGWTVASDGDALVVTGWASTRVVQSDDFGDIVLGRDPTDIAESVRRGRVLFQVVRDDDGFDEGLYDSVAEAVEAAEALAEVHGVNDWSTTWSIEPRWIDAD